MTAHIESKKEDIAKTVIMPGDPLRAKYIADNFLEDARLVNNVRGMLAYTGKYKGKELTVFASGMGIPSMGIYAYELYKFYDVETIIRVGTAGANKEEVKLLDIIIADSAYTLSSYPKLFFDDEERVYESSKDLNDQIEQLAISKKLSYKRGNIITSDVFDVYVDKEKYYANYPKDLDTLASEMEAAALFSIAKHLNKKATAIITVVDSRFVDEEVSSDDRQTKLNDMILLALDSI